MKNKNSVAFISASALVVGFAQGAMGQITINTVDAVVGTGQQYDLDLNGDGTTNYVIRFGGKSDTPSTWTYANEPLVDSRAAQTLQSAQNNFVLGVSDPAQTGATVVGFPLSEAGTTIGQGYLTAGNLGYLYQDNNSSTTVGGWSSTSVSDGYVGLMMLSDGGAVTNFGWVELTYNYNGGTSPTIEVLRTAYDATPDQSLVTPDTVTPTPEPTTVALLGLAGTMVAARMRSRRK
jgi:hypothetical protein